MRIDIRGTNLWLTPALLEHVERRVRSALDRHADRVRDVTVRVLDVNGDRGGLDKACRIVVRTAAARDIVAEDVDTDLYAAVTRAAARTGAAVRSRFDLARREPRRSASRAAGPRAGRIAKEAYR